MRYSKFLVLVVILYLLSLSACRGNDKMLKVGVISDIHYLSEKLMDNGIAINNYVQTSGKSVLDVPSVLDSVIVQYLSSDIEVLLIPGDLTKDGEKQSHLDLVEKLNLLRQNGIRIFVIPGNHDINMPNSIGYEADKTYVVDNVSPEGFQSIYSDYGYRNALAEDSASLSYLSELDDSTWLLAIDASKYDEYRDHSISSGRIKVSTEKWILEILERAKKENKQVIAMMHQGLVEHFPMQASFFKDYLVEDRIRLANLFADNGLKLIFTGHFHANDITEFISNKGNKIYDIETGSLAAYPFPLRFISVSNELVTIKTKNITSTANNPYLSEKNKLQIKNIASKRAFSMFRRFGLEFPDSLQSSIGIIVADLFIKHLEGDEVIDENTRQSLENISAFIVEDSSSLIDNINLDFYPADNNVVLLLNK